MGLGLLYTRLALRPQDEVLTTEHDFYATHEALRLSGARVRRARLYDDPRGASVDEIVTRLTTSGDGQDEGRGPDVGALEHRREASAPRDR